MLWYAFWFGVISGTGAGVYLFPACACFVAAGAGVAVLTVTHDCEFAAESADRIVMMFDGRAAGSGTPGGFFSSADFYTTDIRRITAPFADGCVTLADAARAFVLPDGKEVPR